MIRDYTFKSDNCTLIIHDSENEEMAFKKLTDIVKDPKTFRSELLYIEDIEEDDECGCIDKIG